MDLAAQTDPLVVKRRKRTAIAWSNEGIYVDMPSCRQRSSVRQLHGHARRLVLKHRKEEVAIGHSVGCCNDDGT